MRSKADHPQSTVIQVHVEDIQQLFNSMDPTPFNKRDLDPDAERFIVDWARDLPRDVPLSLLIHTDRKAADERQPEAVRETKKLHQSYSTINWKKAQPAVTKLIAKRRSSEEGQKGLQAFLDKRSPQWSESPYGSPAKI